MCVNNIRTRKHGLANALNAWPRTQHANSILEWFYLLLPGYALGAGLLNLALRASLKALFNYDDAPFAYDITGRPLLFLALSIPVYVRWRGCGYGVMCISLIRWAPVAATS